MGSGGYLIMSNYKLKYSKDLIILVRRKPPVFLKIIKAKIEVLRESPKQGKNIKKLVGTDNVFRLKVGDYRVIYEVNDEIRIVYIFRIKHRKDSYRH